jgi:hypothetical protein
LCLAGACLLLAAISTFGQTISNANPIIWEDRNTAASDLFLGPGGAEMLPNFEKATFLGDQPGGNNLKYRIKDAQEREWIVKIADESQPEVAAVRLLWALGYPTEINYIVPKMSIVNKGSYKNVRIEARPKKFKRGERWSWTDNPFINTREFDGLKLMMAMFNNWDLKDDNNVILQDGDKHYYVIADLGASFGRGAAIEGGRAGRSVNNPQDYASSGFIKGVRNGEIELEFKTYNDHYIKGIKLENARWLADRLLQLSNRQIEDAFRAANYKPEEIAILSKAFGARIRQLDEVTRTAR